MEREKTVNLFHIEEERVNQVAFIFATLAAVEAFLVVVIFLGGPKRDSVILVMPFFGILLRLLEKRTQWMKKYAKYCYMSLPFWCSILLIVDGEGNFAAVTQLYFMWLCLSVAYYEVKMVLFCSGLTISCTAISIFLCPDAMLKLDNLTMWVYILTVYVMATILAVIIAKRMRNLIGEIQKMRLYEDELIYLEQLEQKEEKHSEFIHNMNHYFVAIGELARQENCHQIVGLMEELNVSMLQNERMIYTNHKIINAILSQKMSEAKERNLEFDVYVEPGSKFGEVSSSDWAIMLGNLLDNAFEAGEQCQDEKRRVTLRIYGEKDGGVCVVKITNYFTTKPRRNKSGFITNKREKELHGIGIKSVERTIEKYQGYLQCLVEEETFTAVLILPIKW